MGYSEFPWLVHAYETYYDPNMIRYELISHFVGMMRGDSPKKSLFRRDVWGDSMIKATMIVFKCGIWLVCKL